MAKWDVKSPSHLSQQSEPRIQLFNVSPVVSLFCSGKMVYLADKLRKIYMEAASTHFQFISGIKRDLATRRD